MSLFRGKRVFAARNGHAWTRLKRLADGWISIALALLIVGLIAFAAYELRRACASGARVAILDAIARDPALARQLGDMEEAKCFGGSLYEDNSYGIGHIWFSVRGSEDIGMLYARAMTYRGAWQITSAQLDLQDSGSFFIEGPNPNSSQDSDLRVDRMGDLDTPLPVDRTSAPAWRVVRWDAQNLSFDVPASWQERRRTEDELYLYSSTSDRYLIVHVTPNRNHRSSLAHMRRLEHREREWWRKGRSRLSVFTDIGNLTGYLSWPGRGAKSIVWHGFRKHDRLGTDRIDFLFGAMSSTVFEESRPIFGTILASIHAYD